MHATLPGASRALGLAAAVLLLAPAVRAGQIEVLHSFKGFAEGANPQGMVPGTDGAYYGITTNGGTGKGGTLWRYASGRFSVLHAFTGGADGDRPQCDLSFTAEGVFGTTTHGGTDDAGTLFRYDGDYQVLASFPVQASVPRSGVAIDPAGALYGTTSRGGAYDRGTVWRFDPASATFSLVHAFNGHDGSHPVTTPLLASDGRLVGTTRDDGVPLPGHPDGPGTIWSVATDGSDFSVRSVRGGAGPYGLTPDGAGNAFTVAYSGGLHSVGAILQVAADGRSRSVHAFRSIRDPGGALPSGELLAGPDGRSYYGATSMGGDPDCRCGTVFRYDSIDGTVETLHTFTGPDGSSPGARLAFDAQGRLVGTAGGGGAYGNGTLFQLTLEPVGAQPRVAGVR